MGVSSLCTAEPGVPKASLGLAEGGGGTKMKVSMSLWNTPIPQALC